MGKVKCLPRDSLFAGSSRYQPTFPFLVITLRVMSPLLKTHRPAKRAFDESLAILRFYFIRRGNRWLVFGGC